MITDHLTTLIATFLRLAAPSYRLQLSPSRDHAVGWRCAVTDDNGRPVAGLHELIPELLTKRLEAMEPRSARELAPEEELALGHLFVIFAVWTRSTPEGDPALVFGATAAATSVPTDARAPRGQASRGPLTPSPPSAAPRSAP